MKNNDYLLFKYCFYSSQKITNESIKNKYIIIIKMLEIVIQTLTIGFNIISIDIIDQINSENLLQSMFEEITQEHKALQQQKKQQLKALESKIIDQSLPALNDAVFSKINKGADQIASNQKEIDRRCRQIRDEWNSFNKELDRWNSLINELDKEIRSIGDVKSWSQHIQSEVKEIVDHLQQKPPESS